MEFQGKTFTSKTKFINRDVIKIREITDSDQAWYMDEAKIKAIMPLLLDGPHDEVDWLDAETKDCIGAYTDFFMSFAQSLSASQSISSTSSPSKS